MLHLLQAVEEAIAVEGIGMTSTARAEGISQQDDEEIQERRLKETLGRVEMDAPVLSGFEREVQEITRDLMRMSRISDQESATQLPQLSDALLMTQKLEEIKAQLLAMRAANLPYRQVSQQINNTNP
ncbi:hypothetical protein Pelo_8269 [Pelomyxa schiedti]|nr:hypothetical protein Pelo_8269 [Pelomyxa schiedti]